MNAQPKANSEPTNPIAWTLRDQIAMHAMQALVSKGTFGTTQPDGSHRRYSNFAEYSAAAYEFADYMLKARGV